MARIGCSGPTVPGGGETLMIDGGVIAAAWGAKTSPARMELTAPNAPMVWIRLIGRECPGSHRKALSPKCTTG